MSPDHLHHDFRDVAESRVRAGRMTVLRYARSLQPIWQEIRLALIEEDLLSYLTSPGVWKEYLKPKTERKISR